MKKDRLMELAGVELTESAQMFAAVFDGGDGTFIGMVGPFATEQAANTFFKDNWGDDLRVELSHAQTPAGFKQDMDGE